jgi:environmental stress-induced protein Ves
MSAWLQLRRASELAAVPWRNGHGLTVPLFAADDSDAPDWRISVASIRANAPYSDFAGFQRAQVLLQGGPLHLLVAGEPLVTLAAPGQRVVFDGALTVDARIDDSCALFNTAIRPGCGELRSWLRPVLGTFMLPVSSGVQWFGYVLGGQMSLRCGADRHLLHQGDAFAINDQALPRAVLDGGGTLALAQLVPADNATVQLVLCPLPLA